MSYTGQMRRLKRLGLVLLAILVAAFALVGVLTMTRGTPVEIVISEGAEGPPAVTDSLFERVFELYTGTHISAGNRVEQMLNGDGTYPRLWQDLRSARSTITVQMYYSLPGAVADTMSAILRARARAGVRVLLVLDAFGSQTLKKEWVDSLRAARVEVGILRKLRWYTIHNTVDRSHVRVVVVDGRIGYTGGFGLADYWLGDGLHENQWRESNVRFEGPAVMQLQGAFASAWAEATGELIAGSRFFPSDGFAERGSVHAGLLFAQPTTGSTPAERFVALTIAGARRTLYIANSYFVPDDDFRRLLKAAAKRGVDVRILTVNEKTDVKTTWYAGRYRYEELLGAGIRIYEFQPTMMHSKTMIADGVWGTIGSMNLDNRSMAFNNESNLVFLDSTVGAQMHATFLADLAHSREIRLEEFRRRGRWTRLLEGAAAMISRLL
jgi:cardiolipin synthase A/B